MHQQEEDGWIVVTKTKNIKKYRKMHNKSSKDKVISEKGASLYQQGHEQSDVEDFLLSTSSKKNKEIISNAISQILQKYQIINLEVQCLGIGDFTKYFKPRYQFYFLCQLLLPILKQFEPETISLNVYDPAFTEECKIKIQKLGGTYKEYTGKVKSKQNHLKIFFMPHCQKFLYDLVCQSETRNCLIIGNSLKQYIEREQMLGEALSENMSKKIGQQIKLHDYKQCFNDTYVYMI